jgi:hypothetical protein
MELISRIKGSNFGGGELEIINGATTRSVEEKEERERGAIFLWWLYGGWRDSFMSHANHHGVTRSPFDRTGLSVTSQQSTRLSRVMCTSVTQVDMTSHRHRVTRLPHKSCQ